MLSEEKAIELFEAELKPDQLFRCSETDCWYGVLKSELLSYTRKVEQAARAELLAGVGMDTVGYIQQQYISAMQDLTSPLSNVVLNGISMSTKPQNDDDIALYTADQLAAAVAKAKAEQQWQPIETAPKTGRKIIVSYINRLDNRRSVMARWITEDQAAECDGDDVGLEEGWYECIDNWDDYTEVAITEGEPTHWMPLPAKPSADAIHKGGAE